MSGFFLVRRDCLLGIPFQQSGFKLLLEILVRARISSVREMPFAFGRRFRGSSKANVKVALEYGRLLARLYRSRFGLRRAIPVDSFD
jgi:dolichol-phosphate mannosyltransferase